MDTNNNNNNNNDNDKKTPTKRYSLRDHTHTKTNMLKSLNPEADEFIPGGEFSSAASSPEMISSPEKKKGKKGNGKKAGRKEMWVKKKKEGVKGVKGTGSPVSKKKNGGEKMGLEDESGVQADFGGGEDGEFLLLVNLMRVKPMCAKWTIPSLMTMSMMWVGRSRSLHSTRHGRTLI